jgi:aspartate racemase
MKIIGIIGGLSWESSSEYYRIVNEETAARLGDLHAAKCILYSVDFGEIAPLMARREWDAVEDALVRAGRGLKAAGADLIIIATNTMHRFAGTVEREVGLPLLHIVDATGEAVQDAGLSTVGLLGTKVTMEEDFYRERLETTFGIDVVIPGADDRAFVDTVIFDELCRGILRDTSKQEFCRIIDRLAGAGAEGIILGCTEIPLLISAGDAPVPLFDTTRIHATAAVDAALRGE